MSDGQRSIGMDWLAKTWNRIASFLQSLSPPARWTLALSVVVIGAGLVYLNATLLTDRFEFLLGERVLSDEEIHEVQTAFARAGLNDWLVEGNRVRVPHSKRDRYLAALDENGGAPAEFGSASHEMLNSQSLFEPGSVRQLRQRHAMERELSLVVSRMAGIQEATVKYDEVEMGGFPVTRRKTAMVAASASGRRDLGDELVGSIRDLVAGAIAGLEPQDVTVTDLGSGRTYRGDAAPSAPSIERHYVAAKSSYEEGYRERIAEMLSIYPGVVITVNADVAPSNHSPVAAAPQARWNGGVQEPPLPAVSPDAATAGDAYVSTGEPPSRPYHEPSAWIPTRIAAAVSVPRSYFLEVWRQRHRLTGAAAPARPTPEMLRQVETEVHETIERQVRAVLPASPPALAADELLLPDPSAPLPAQVVVSTYDDLPPVEWSAANWLPAPGDAVQWAERNWPVAAIAAAALLGGLALIWTLRGRRPALPPRAPDAPAHPPASDAPDAPDIADRGELAEAAWESPRAPGPEALRDELTAIVQRDPDAAAGILRDWIGEAA